ncbi:SDR family oxidoreductase [Alicyclobacillus curvatus]|nr:SDR family oxidoreductase [Alicyclobacillus curvatus]
MVSKHGKVLLITGASSGIGAHTARFAVTAGYRVVLAARSVEKLNHLASELGSESTLVVPCDVSDWASQRQMFDHVLEHFGRIDAVFANAAVVSGSPFFGGEDTPNEWRDMVLTNVFGAATTARMALPELVKTQGHLIFTGSVTGKIALPGSFYSSSKWAITGMAESIRQQVTGQGVRVTLVVPGMVDTPLWDGNPPKVPLLNPEDIASAVIFALSQPPNVDVNEIVIRPVGQPR